MPPRWGWWDVDKSKTKKKRWRNLGPWAVRQEVSGQADVAVIGERASISGKL